jgi:hypothetical protein
MNKTPEIEFHLIRRWDGGLVIHKATTLGEFLSFREDVEKDIANSDSRIGWQSYTIVYPKATEVYSDPKRLISKIVDRTLVRIRNGGKENVA